MCKNYKCVYFDGEHSWHCIACGSKPIRLRDGDCEHAVECGYYSDNNIIDKDMDSDIGWLDLRPGTYCKLKRNNINTVEDLRIKDWSEILKIIGRSKTIEVKKALELFKQR